MADSLVLLGLFHSGTANVTEWGNVEKFDQLNPHEVRARRKLFWLIAVKDEQKVKHVGLE